MRLFTALLGPLLVLAAIVTPVVVAKRHQARTRNLRVVRDGALYRSGQMTLPGLKAEISAPSCRSTRALDFASSDVSAPPM